MLILPRLSNINFSYNSQPIKRKNNAQADFKPVYTKNLNKDIVSFGAYSTQELFPIEYEIKSAHRASDRYKFSCYDVGQISAAVSDKNRPFLTDIITLNDGTITKHVIIRLLNHIDKDDTNVEEFKRKLDIYRILPQIVQGFGFTKSPIGNYFNSIPSWGVADILESDALLELPDYDFNSFIDTYNYAAKRLKRKEQKTIKSGKSFDTEREAKEIMSEFFPIWVRMGMVFDENVLNEFSYNRNVYLGSVYYPRYKSLNRDELELLKQVQLFAVTDKETKDGNFETYPISIGDRIRMMNILAANRKMIDRGENGLDIQSYFVPMENQNFKVDFLGMQTDLLAKQLLYCGVEPEVVDKYITDYTNESNIKYNRHRFWDSNYAHLFDAPEGSLLRKIIVSATNGTFEDMIYKEGELARINRRNANDFACEGINYNKWLHPDVAPRSQEFEPKETKNNNVEVNKRHPGRKNKSEYHKQKGKHIFTVKNWRRIPQESLFDGNYTTCCTGIDKNHGASFLHFLTNTCTTTLEVRNENNKVVAMSRLLLAKVGDDMWSDEDNKLALVVENIEVNNNVAKNYLHTPEARYKFREMIFDYVRDFAKDISYCGKEIPIYFSAKYPKVKGILDGLKPSHTFENAKLVGEFPDKIYINSYGALYEKSDDYYKEDGDNFKLHLIDITQKTPYIEPKEQSEDGEDGYNYADLGEYK